MGCDQCLRGFGFTILSLITIGASTALFAIALYFIATKFKDISNTLMVIVVLALCVSILVLLFALYASVKGNKCVRTILVFIYIIYAFIVGAAAIFLFAFKGKLMDLIETGVKDKNNSDIIHSITEAFKCEMNVNETVNHTKQYYFKGSNCEDEVSKFYKAKLPPIGGCLIGIFVILVIGIVLSFRYLCCVKDNQDLSTTEPINKSKDQLNSPLTYGW